MTDRELLERAAKAIGLRVGFELDGREKGRYDLFWSHVHNKLCWHNKQQGSEYPGPVFWDPFNDDGDAMRLALACYGVNEIGAATYRRAIVRAAAAMCKG